jgi:uncharacterized DUF497 family protein
MERNDFEWNEAKREINIRIHRIDFEDSKVLILFGLRAEGASEGTWRSDFLGGGK